jgi:predicted nucleic acid-binding protein
LRGWLLDTNVIASLSATEGAPSVKAWARGRSEEDLYLSVLTLAEYDKGVAQLADTDARRAVYSQARDAIESRFGRRILMLDNAVVRRWGELTGRVRRDTGHPPPVIDTLLAATAIEHDLCLVTRNIKDVRHSGADLFNPWEATA